MCVRHWLHTNNVVIYALSASAIISISAITDGLQILLVSRFRTQGASDWVSGVRIRTVSATRQLIVVLLFATRRAAEGD